MKSDFFNLKYSFCSPLDSAPGAAAPLARVYYILRGKISIISFCR
jgi:hypothetical protein